MDEPKVALFRRWVSTYIACTPEQEQRAREGRGTVQFDFEAYKLKIDTLCREGFYLQKVMRFFRLSFGPKHIPQVEQNNSGHIEGL